MLLFSYCYFGIKSTFIGTSSISSSATTTYSNFCDSITVGLRSLLASNGVYTIY